MNSSGVEEKRIGWSSSTTSNPAVKWSNSLLILMKIRDLSDSTLVETSQFWSTFWYQTEEESWRGITDHVKFRLFGIITDVSATILEPSHSLLLISIAFFYIQFHYSTFISMIQSIYVLGYIYNYTYSNFIIQHTLQVTQVMKNDDLQKWAVNNWTLFHNCG